MVRNRDAARETEDAPFLEAFPTVRRALVEGIFRDAASTGTKTATHVLYRVRKTVEARLEEPAADVDTHDTLRRLLARVVTAEARQYAEAVLQREKARRGSLGRCA